MTTQRRIARGEPTVRWCPTCGRMTQHQLTKRDGGLHAGPCAEHTPPELTKAQQTRRRDLQRRRQQPSLFDKTQEDR